jgi:hypothetical protein
LPVQFNRQRNEFGRSLVPSRTRKSRGSRNRPGDATRIPRCGATKCAISPATALNRRFWPGGGASQLSFREPLLLFGGVFGFGAGQLLGMNNGLVDRAAGGAEIWELAVDSIALQDIDRRHRLAADQIGGGALDNRPVYPTGTTFFFDILKAAVDHRVGLVKLALDLSRRRIASTPRRTSPTIARTGIPTFLAPIAAGAALALLSLTAALLSSGLAVIAPLCSRSRRSPRAVSAPLP